MTIKTLLKDHGIMQVDISKALSISTAAVSQIVNKHQWPVRERELLKQKLTAFLINKDVPEKTVNTAIKSASTAATDDAQTTDELEVEPMLLRKQTLTPAARSHFKLIANPFGDINDKADVFLNDDMRYARALMDDAANRGGFVAVVGESGSGKTTLKNDLIDRIIREQQQIVVIQPYVLAMEDNDIKGKTLKAVHIAEAILREVAHHERPLRSAEARFRQVDKALRESSRMGNKHVLIIEEAHSLPVPTLKHLKRFLELQDGFTRLLSIILIGQTELATVLSEQNAAVREVVQRCEIINIPSLGSTLEDYIQFRFNRSGSDYAKVFTADGIQAIYDLLQPPVPKGHRVRSLLYPLAVNNLSIAALNLAADMGAPNITADIVNEVRHVY
jgi:type II secretory pathway predicted ATPase ExeA